MGDSSPCGPGQGPCYSPLTSAALVIWNYTAPFHPSSVWNLQVESSSDCHLRKMPELLGYTLHSLLLSIFPPFWVGLGNMTHEGGTEWTLSFAECSMILTCEQQPQKELLGERSVFYPFFLALWVSQFLESVCGGGGGDESLSVGLVKSKGQQMISDKKQYRDLSPKGPISIPR